MLHGEQQYNSIAQIDQRYSFESEYIDAGNQAMVQAIEIQKTIRRKQCFIATIVVLIVLAVVAGLIATIINYIIKY